MRLFSLILCAIWPIGIALGASSKDGDKYLKFKAASRSSGAVSLDDASYLELTAAPRDYHTIVLLTALDPRFGCDICKMFQPEWNLLTRTWNRAKLGESKVVFGTLDFTSGRSTFQQLKLQTAPIILLFPPSTGPASKNKPARYDFTNPVTAEQMHLWISRHLPDVPKPNLVRPVNYSRVIGMLIGALAVISIVTVSSKYILPLLRSRNLWTALSLLAILLFTTGHMFNHIRKVPYVAGDGKGGISYFAGGFQTQFGLESQIIAAIYGVLSLGSIALAMKAPRILDPQSQRVTIILWSAVTWVMYSFLISVFRGKNASYPLSIPPF
ncbi:oligosaccharyl transferase subunit ost3/OST6 [Microsporum canis]|uniref:Dolichyl-diphosphooligosaccharide-protein glycotransferase n=1 Tax=Arthroderma otae (strain ATCC MYA-4605 / CBS 113480) TaxID=554155 RepID=C5FFB8_ARTOC|nr:dolichyl-diphosphooligosaccharide-protein glycotransferase [Microsporum canis CBS 113480]EEQ28502.1 dolichyl-diphosphooligosaccharide-protein glycotransferase [Microsporum canis CBS 113480]